MGMANCGLNCCLCFSLRVLKIIHFDNFVNTHKIECAHVHVCTSLCALACIYI
jgi:hypothetical protein